MDAGDADGADALLSLAALANDAMGDYGGGVPGLPEAATRELEAKLEAATAAAEAAAAQQADAAAHERPKRQRREPLRADVRAASPFCMLPYLACLWTASCQLQSNYPHLNTSTARIALCVDSL